MKHWKANVPEKKVNTVVYSGADKYANLLWGWSCDLKSLISYYTTVETSTRNYVVSSNLIQKHSKVRNMYNFFIKIGLFCLHIYQIGIVTFVYLLDNGRDFKENGDKTVHFWELNVRASTSVEPLRP